MEDRKYYIYKYQNKINGKIYIGKSKRIKQRIWEHMRCSGKENSLLHKDIRKYGYENFDVEILDDAISEMDSVDLEKFYINKYNCIVPNGYNQTRGGVGGHNAKSVVCLNLDGTFVKRYYSSGETKKDGYCDSDVLLCCKNKQQRVKDKIFMFEDEYLEKGGKVYVKPKPNGMKPVIQCDCDGNMIAEYKSVKEASQKTGIPRPRISSVLTGYSKHAQGYIFVYKEEYPICDVSKYEIRKKGRKVAQLDKDTGEIINVFERIADAGRALNVSYKPIHKVLDLEDRTAYGYKWISC